MYVENMGYIILLTLLFYRKYELEQAEKAEHQLLLEHDIRKAIDRIHELETNQNNITKERDNKDKIIRELTQASIVDKENLEKSNVSLEFKNIILTLLIELQSTTSTYNQTMQQLQELKNQYNTQSQLINTTKEEKDDDMTQRYIDLKMRVHELEESNDSLYQQLLLKDNEIEKLIVSTPIAPPAEDVNNNIPLVKDDEMDNKKYIGNDVYGMYLIIIINYN